jgi:hypothetical protein
MDFFLKWFFAEEDDSTTNHPTNGQHASSNYDDNMNHKAVTFKITATDFGKFDGRPEHWFPFKNKTESTLGIAGFSSLVDDNFPIKDTEGNWRLYYLLEGATNDGAASHIVKKHKVMKDGRAAWLSLKDWYEGKTMAGDIAKTCRVKLQALELTPKGDANTYINEFIRLKDQLEETGEGERPATLIDQFLDQIKDSKYDVTVTSLRMDGSKTLENCIEAIRKHDLVLARQRINSHRFSKVRRVNATDDTSTHQPTSTYIQPEVWVALTPAQRKAIIQARERDTSEDAAQKDTHANKQAQRRARRAHARNKAKEQKRQEKVKGNQDGGDGNGGQKE